jgi:hypothetical protein
MKDTNSFRQLMIFSFAIPIGHLFQLLTNIANGNEHKYPIWYNIIIAICIYCCIYYLLIIRGNETDK